MMYVVDAAYPFRSIRQPLQVEKNGQLTTISMIAPGLSHPGQFFLDSPHGEEPNVQVC